MEIKKTDNHYMADKVQLRIDHAPWHDAKALTVLDVFGGHGVVWSTIERITGQPIVRIGVDKRDDLLQAHLHGDNLKVMAGLNLNAFDVIDLDAYGVPYEHLRLLFDRHYHGCVFVTFITTVHGRLPNGLLLDSGFSEAMITKAPTLCSKRGWDIFKRFLARNGVTSVVHRSKGRKHYLAVSLTDAGDGQSARASAEAANQ